MKPRHVRKLKKGLIAAFFILIALMLVLWTMAPLLY